MKINIAFQYSEEKNKEGYIEQDILILAPQYDKKFCRKNIISTKHLEYIDVDIIEYERNYIISTTINEALSNIIKTFNN